MTKHLTPARRVAWLMLSATALTATATAGHAQDAPVVPTPPPPVVATNPPPPAPATTGSTQVDPASRTTIAPGAGDVVDDARIAARQEARAARRAPARRAPAPRAAEPAPVATTPVPVIQAPAPAAPVATAPVTETPAAPAETETATTTTRTSDGNGGWTIAIVAGLVVIAGVALLLWRRSRREEEYHDAYVEPEYVHAGPVHDVPVATAAAIPAVAASDVTAHDGIVTPDDATVATAEAEDVAALTAAAPGTGDRPWLEFAMRPVRAGTSDDEAVVEIELTVANAGAIAAEDVRVSTFMLTDAHASEMERMLVDPPADAAVAPVTIQPGEGTRIDATLAALKADLGGAGRFSPVVVADARYRLPDGSEGRTSASFVVGVSHEGDIAPLDLAEGAMRDDIEARLHGEPQHA